MTATQHKYKYKHKAMPKIPNFSETVILVRFPLRHLPPLGHVIEKGAAQLFILFKYFLDYLFISLLYINVVAKGAGPPATTQRFIQKYIFSSFFLLHLFKNRLRSSSYHLPVKIARFQKAERLSRFSEKSDKNVKENGNQTIF